MNKNELNHSREFSEDIQFTNFEEDDESNNDKSQIPNVNISHLEIDDNNPNLDLEDYKKEVDKIIEEKKKKLSSLFQFNKPPVEEKIKIYFQKKLEEDLKAEREKPNPAFEKKKRDLEASYKERTEKMKENMKEDFQTEIEKKWKDKLKEMKKQEEECTTEVNSLKNQLNELKQKKEQQSTNTNVDNEIKRIEQSYETSLKNYISNLEEQLMSKKLKLKALYSNKKAEFENSLKKNMQINQSQVGRESILKEKKNIILKAHEAKLEHYKNSLLLEYSKNSEKEKEEAVFEFQKELQVVKDNYEQLKKFYDEQRIIFSTEQSVIESSNFINKLKSIFENKNTIFKNLLDQNYFLLRKKLKEMENVKELASFTNKESILAKISELLTMIFYGNIYEYLYIDINSERDLLSVHLEDLIHKCELIVSNFNSDKKIQLGMYLCNPNFN